MDVLNSKSVKVKVGDQELEIGEFKVKHIRKISKHIGTVTSLFGKGQITGEDYVGAFDCVSDLIQTVTGKDEKYIDDLSIEQSMDIVNAVLEVNADSFLSKILPKFTTMVEGLNQKAGKIQTKTGQPASKS